MSKNIFIEVNNLIEKKEINKAQFELSKLHVEHKNNPEYLFLRSKIFYLNKLYYLAIDTLFVALEFEQSDKIYNLISEIYGVLGNNELKEKILDSNSRLRAINLLKDQLTGIYRK